MRILHINKFHWLAGGVERYLFDVAALFESRGHEIIHFSMEDPRNRPCAQSKYFASNLHYGDMGAARAVRQAGRVLGGTVYSFEAREKLRALVRDLRPDVAHIHLIEHHLSPSVLHALRDEGVPAVQTAHEYKLVCPNYQLYVPRTGEVCERCLPGKFYHCTAQRCMKDSIGASVLAAGAKYFHRATGVFEKNVRAFLYATEFVGSKLAQGGLPPAKLKHVPLYIDRAPFLRRPAKGDHIVYAGRLAAEKGVVTLLRAMRQLPDVPMRVIGDGPLRGELEAFAREHRLANVTFLGFLEGEAYGEQLGGARALVIPSEWYEPCGLVIWEAQTMGVAPIGSRIGGIPESIEDGETGLLFEAGNPDDLAAKIRAMLGDPAGAARMAERGAARVRAHCDAHYGRLMAVYEEAIAGAGA